MTQKEYKTPAAFRHALDERIRKEREKTGLSFERIRNTIVYDRFIVRLASEFGDSIMVKGGVALEMRLERARATKDIDIRLEGDAKQILQRLQAAGALDERDYFTFEVSRSKHPEVEGDGAVYGGERFRARALIGGHEYHSFGVDVGIADMVTEAPDIVESSEFITFVKGVERREIRLYPRNTHVAEKLHAMTLPRTTLNSRVRDLPDIALLSQTGAFEASSLREAIQATFDFRDTHDVPAKLPDPPPQWADGYEKIRVDAGLEWASLEEVFKAAAGFLDPALGGETGTWDPEALRWKA